VSSKFFRKFTDIQREYRVSLGTSKKKEALRLGARLYCEYDELFSDALDMTKFEWEGKEVDVVEWMARNTQKLKAEKAAKKARNQENLKEYFNEALQNIFTDDEKKSGLLNVVQGLPDQAQVKGKHPIDKVFQAYIDEKRSTKAWKEKSEGSIKAVLKIFSEIMDGRRFDAIGYDEMRRYKEIILKLPKNLNCDNRFKEKKITEIIQIPDLDLLSNKTRNKHLGTMSTLFEWAMRHGFTDKNYAKGLTVIAEDQQIRDVFTKDDLQKIISSDEYKRVKAKQFKKHAFFWAPLISMFTGARLSEICQLKVSDICEDGGIWYFAFCSDGMEVAKTKAAIGNVPIHEMLIKIGLLNYVKSQKRRNETLLFSDLTKHSKNGYGAQVSKWFNRYLIKVGVKDVEKDTNRKVFHSFRHTVIHHLQQKGVDEKRIEVMVGHETDELSYYQHDVGLKILADEVVGKIDYGVDFEHLIEDVRWK
jgi:integrase